MKAYIDVADEAERDQIAEALCDPVVRAFVKIVGTLKPLDEDTRQRVMGRVCKRLDIDV
jgi:cobyric acid synthase